MCEKSFAFLCCVLLLLLTSSSKSQQISTNNKEKGDNLTIRNKVDTNKIDEDSTTIYSDEITVRYDLLYEKFTNNTRYGMQNEFRINSTNNDRENVDSILYKISGRSVDNHEDDDQIPMNSHTNSTNVNHNENFTSQEVYEYLLEKNDSMSIEVFENFSKYSNESINIVPYEMCHNITCILLCCPFGDRLVDDKCIPGKIGLNHFPTDVYTNDSMQSENKRVDELFQLAVYDSCQKYQRVRVDYGHQYDYKIFANGSIYLSYYKSFVKSTSYCLAVFLERGDKLEVTFCSDTLDDVLRNAEKYTPKIRSSTQALNIYACFRTVCILFLAPILLVYSILPELRNIHGLMLCNYCAATSVAYIVYVVNIIHYKADSSYFVCITLAFLEYYWFMSSVFWQSAMSFNMWRTFRGFGSLQRNVRQTEKKKLVYYVIFAYGCPFILAVVFVIIMDFVSEYLPKNLQPEFWLGNCWYYGKHLEMYTLYFQGFRSACIIISICLSISAALKIKYYEKDTGVRLTDSESKRYNDNKKWFNLYLKLFITVFTVMGIRWSVLTTIWLLQNANYVLKYYLFVFINLIEIVQNLCIFIIFVCKKKIKLMLLKRFGCGTNVTSST